MKKSRQGARTVYIMVAADVVLVLLFFLVIAPVPEYFENAWRMFWPTVLIVNYLFLRYKLKASGKRQGNAESMHRFWFYVASGWSFTIVLGGLLTVFIEDLPKILFLVLLLYLLFGLYLKMAEKPRGSG